MRIHEGNSSDALSSNRPDLTTEIAHLEIGSEQLEPHSEVRGVKKLVSLSLNRSFRSMLNKMKSFGSAGADEVEVQSLGERFGEKQQSKAFVTHIPTPRRYNSSLLAIETILKTPCESYNGVYIQRFTNTLHRFL